MKNAYAKDYYNTYLKDLSTDYKSARWFSSPSARLDFDQTRAVLIAALKNKEFGSAIEIGPGDGVWTDLLIPKVKSLTLLDQSIEMITRAKERLKEVPNISFVNNDFLTYQPTQKFDLVFAIRCFEYFEDKEVALKQFDKLLNPGGILIVVTKNPNHATMASVQEKELHKGQVNKKQMHDLLSRHGFNTVSTLSATWRFKAKYAVMRVLFRCLHQLHVMTNGKFVLPTLSEKLTESYLYVAKKN